MLCSYAMVKGGFGSTRDTKTSILLITGLIFCLAFPESSTPISFTPASYVYPVMSPRFSSGFGMRLHPIKKFGRLHKGLDLAAPHGSPIRSIAEGVVVFADPYAGYGKLVVVKHNARLTSHYGHCQEINAKPGMRVKAGQIIATVGSSGHSTGPHLHFEIRLDGEAKDPESFLSGFSKGAEG